MTYYTSEGPPENPKEGDHWTPQDKLLGPDPDLTWRTDRRQPQAKWITLLSGITLAAVVGLIVAGCIAGMVAFWRWVL